jgi:hypothetical protein
LSPIAAVAEIDATDVFLTDSVWKVNRWKT